MAELRDVTWCVARVLQNDNNYSKNKKLFKSIFEKFHKTVRKAEEDLQKEFKAIIPRLKK